MKSTKYQLLQDDFKSAIKDIRLRNDRIKELEEEIKKLNGVLKWENSYEKYAMGLELKIQQFEKEKLEAYHNGYQQGAFDEKMSWLHQDHEN